MKKMRFHVLWLGLMVSLVAANSHAVPNPAAAYAEKLGYVYTANEAGGTVTMPDGAVLNAWDFFRGKVGSEYAYGAQYGYDTVNRSVETNGYVRSFAVCVPKDPLRKGTTAEISLLDLMRQNGEPLWDYSRGATPAALEPILKTAPLKTFPKQALPSSFDWRNVGGLSYIGSVRNQGNCGSCYSFGAAAAAEGAYNYALGRTGSSCVDFSEAYIAWCLGKYGAYSSHFGGCDGADYDYQELEALTVEGICGENQMPYNSGSDPGSCTYSGTTTVFEAWYRVPSGNIDAIKTAIMTYGVVDAAVLTDDAFMDYDTGVYDNNNNDCNSGYNETSDHAISLVGWDDNPPEGGGGVFILRNSWGASGTGEGGYMRIRTNAAVVHCAVCYMVYDSSLSTTSAPAFTSGTNYTATTGVARTFTVTASGNPAPALSFVSSTATAGSYGFTNATGVLSYTPPTDDVGTKTFTFKATNVAGSVTQRVQVVVSLAPPTAPASIWASATNTTDFTAAWSAVSGATGYRLDVATNSSFGGGPGGTLINEGFDNGITAPNGWIFTAIGGTYTSAGNFGNTSPSLKLDATGDAVQTPPLSSPTNVSFWVKGQTSTGSSLLLEGASGGSWSTITNITTLPNTATIYSCPVGTSVTNLRFTYNKVSSNVAFDDVLVLAGAAGGPSYVAGYSNRTVAGTSQSVTGLTAGAIYYFRARATNAAGSSANSSVTNVTTLATLSAPTFGANPGPIAATAGVAKSFTVAASGVPTPTLALSSQTASGGYSFNAGTGQLTYTPPQADQGTKTFTFSATNSQGTAYQAVTVNVAAATAPAFTGGAGPYSTTVGVAVAFTVTASGTAPTLALQSQTASSGYSFTPSSGAFSYTPPAGDVGTRTFTFTAANAAGTATQVTSVSVAAVPTAPNAPASVWASATNATGFTAAWSAADGATSYRLDVATNATFSGGGAAGASRTNDCADVGGGSTSSYLTRTWTNNGSVVWNAYKARTDQTVNGNPSICLKNEAGAYLISENIPNGIGSLSFDVQQMFSGSGGELTVYVNGASVGTFAYGTTVQTATFANVDVSGVATLVVSNNAATRLAINNLVWTDYASGAPAYVSGYSNLTVSGTSQSVSGLATGATYYFRVRAVNAVGTSGDSSVASVTTTSGGGGSEPVVEITTLPTNAAERLSLELSTTQAGSQYILEYTTNLLAVPQVFIQAAPGVNGTGGAITLQDPTNANVGDGRYYRILKY